MTSLLTYTVAYSNKPSFRPKTNNQPLKKLVSLAVSWVKVVKNGKILTFKVNFLRQKLSESFQIFFSLKNIKSGAQLILMTLFDYCHFWSTLFTKIGSKFQTLIPNQALICQRPFKVRKCLFPFNYFYAEVAEKFFNGV